MGPFPLLLTMASHVRWFANAKTWHNLTPNIIVQFLASFTLFITFFALALLVRCKTWRDMSQQHWRDALHFVHSKEVWEGGVGELMVFICANFPNIYIFSTTLFAIWFSLEVHLLKKMKETLKIIKTISLFLFFFLFFSLSPPCKFYYDEDTSLTYSMFLDQDPILICHVLGVSPFI